LINRGEIYEENVGLDGVFELFGNRRVRSSLQHGLTFEDLYPGSQTAGDIPDNYQGFEWSYPSHWITKYSIPGTGYEYGTIGNVSLFTGTAHISFSVKGGSFDFNNAYITAALESNVNVNVQGWLSGTKMYEIIILTHNNVYNEAPYWFSFNFTNIDTVKFLPNANHIVVDNISLNNINLVPLPCTVLLLGSGLLGLVGWRRFRKG
jgi:hypothetical protein